jgi:hypothetical protein
VTGTEPTARPEDDALDSLDAVIVQYERAMHELGWTMVNVRARDAVATVREALERQREERAGGGDDYRLAMVSNARERMQVAEDRAESAEAEVRRLTEGLRDLIKEAPEALDQNAVWVDDLLDLLSASPSDGGGA